MNRGYLIIIIFNIFLVFVLFILIVILCGPLFLRLIGMGISELVKRLGQFRNADVLLEIVINRSDSLEREREKERERKKKREGERKREKDREKKSE